MLLNVAYEATVYATMNGRHWGVYYPEWMVAIGGGILLLLFF